MDRHDAAEPILARARKKVRLNGGRREGSGLSAVELAALRAYHTIGKRLERANAALEAGRYRGGKSELEYRQDRLARRRRAEQKRWQRARAKRASLVASPEETHAALLKYYRLRNQHRLGELDFECPIDAMSPREQEVVREYWSQASGRQKSGGGVKLSGLGNSEDEAPVIAERCAFVRQFGANALAARDRQEANAATARSA